MSKGLKISSLVVLGLAAFILMNAVYTVNEVQQMIITQFGKPVGERLVETAQGFGADMIVMGGYRHPKLAQRLLGGPSHFLVSNSPVPILLSH